MPGSFIRKLRKLPKFASIALRRSMQLGGTRYHLPALRVQRMAIDASDANYEPDLKALFRRELAMRQGHFVDVGANFGQTLLALLEIDASRPYIGFDPQPACVAQLQSFIERNELADHLAICACLGDGDKLRRLGLGYEGDVRASIVASHRPAGTFTGQLVCPSISGDQAIDELEIDAISIVKIDVEGAELEVLRSFRKTLERLRPTVTFEILPDFLVADGSPIDETTRAARRAQEKELTQYLAEIGYEAKLLAGDAEMSEPIAPSRDVTVRNYVARPI